MLEIYYELSMEKEYQQDFQNICNAACDKLRKARARDPEIDRIQKRDCRRISLESALAVLDVASDGLRPKLTFRPILEREVGWFANDWIKGRKVFFSSFTRQEQASPLIQICLHACSLLPFLYEGAQVSFGATADGRVDVERFVLAIPKENRISRHRAGQNGVEARFSVREVSDCQTAWYSPLSQHVISRDDDCRHPEICARDAGIREILGNEWEKSFTSSAVMLSTALFLIEARGEVSRDICGTSLAVGAQLFAPAMIEWNRIFYLEPSIPTNSDAILALVQFLSSNVREGEAWLASQACKNKLVDLGLTGVQFTHDQRISLAGLARHQELAIRLLFPPHWIISAFTLDESSLDSNFELLA